MVVVFDDDVNDDKKIISNVFDDDDKKIISNFFVYCYNLPSISLRSSCSSYTLLMIVLV